MANIAVHWSKTKPISISDVARDLGFDLRRYADQPEEIRAFMKKLTIDQAIGEARQCWRDNLGGAPAPGGTAPLPVRVQQSD